MGYESAAAERSSEHSLDTNQQGPPPSYDAVVAMDNASGVLHPKCKKRTIINRCSLYDPSDQKHHYRDDGHEMTGGDTEEMDSKCDVSGTSDDESLPSSATVASRPRSINNEQILNVTDINRRAVIRRQSNCCCEHLAIDRPYDIVKLCKLCGREIRSLNSESVYRQSNTQYCNCYELPEPNVNRGHTAASAGDNDVDKCNNNCALTVASSTTQLNDVNDNNMPSTSSHCEGNTSNSNRFDRNCDNCQTNNDNDVDKKGATNSAVNFETLNENGLIRLDMSQIIDHTGLPTYEAALKLESSGYV